MTKRINSDDDEFSFSGRKNRFAGLGDLESRVDDLESARNELREQRGGGDPTGCLMIFYFPGMALATAISWSLNHSILWGLIHGLCSWGYLVYYIWWVR